MDLDSNRVEDTLEARIRHSTLQLLTGLESRADKFMCYSPEYDLDSCPWRSACGAAIGCLEANHTSRGVMVGGVPIGSEGYVLSVLGTKADEVVSYIDSTIDRLREHPHALWASLYYCCQTRFDYWLRHVPACATMQFTPRIDDALMRGVTALTYTGCIDDPLTLRRIRLPARM